MKKPKLLLILLALVCVPLFAREKLPQTYTLQTPPEPDYSGIQWLVGDWAGKTTGPGPQGQVLLNVAYQLGKRFLLMREEVSLPATKNAPATHESLMGILNGGASGQGLNLNLYSSSGFVTHYRVIVKNGEVTFQPEGGMLPPPGWLFRRIITHTSPGQCVERVEVAPPGKSFFEYYTADLSQVNEHSIKIPSASQQPPTPKHHHRFKL